VLGQEERRGGRIEEEERVRKEGAKKEGKKKGEEERREGKIEMQESENAAHHQKRTPVDLKITTDNVHLTHLLMTFFPVAGAADTGAVCAAVVFLGGSALSTSETSFLTALRRMASSAARAKRNRNRDRDRK
jgi:hypothetical protein